MKSLLNSASKKFDMIHYNVSCINVATANLLFIDTSDFSEVEAVKNKEGEIIAVTLQNDFTIARGDQILVKGLFTESLFDVKSFGIVPSEQLLIIRNSDLTLTSWYLVPIMNKTREQLSYDNYFINAYLSEDYKNLCLVYRNTGSDNFLELENKLTKFRIYKRKIDYDKYRRIYFFRIPVFFMDDIELFLKGQYSQFSDKLKKLIIKFAGGDLNTRICHVLNKTRELKELIEEELDAKLDNVSELDSIPDPEKEVLKKSF